MLSSAGTRCRPSEPSRPGPIPRPRRAGTPTPTRISSSTSASAGGNATAGAPRMAAPTATTHTSTTSSRPSASSTPTRCSWRERGSPSRWPRWSSHTHRRQRNRHGLHRAGCVPRRSRVRGRARPGNGQPPGRLGNGASERDPRRVSGTRPGAPQHPLAWHIGAVRGRPCPECSIPVKRGVSRRRLSLAHRTTSASGSTGIACPSSKPHF